MRPAKCEKCSETRNLTWVNPGKWRCSKHFHGVAESKGMRFNITLERIPFWTAVRILIQTREWSRVSPRVEVLIPNKSGYESAIYDMRMIYHDKAMKL